MEPVDLDIGMALLQVMKKDLLLKPCRTSLDFLLSSCVSARDLSCARSIWKEYEEACLPHNVSSYLRLVTMFNSSIKYHMNVEFVAISVHTSVYSRCYYYYLDKYGDMLWYEKIPLNRMYQVMLATGEQESAAGMLKWIPTNDPHVRDIVKACKSAFDTVHSNRGKRTKISVNQNG